MFEYQQLIALSPKEGAGNGGSGQGWSIFAGMDEQSVFAILSGGRGHIGSTLNLMPGAYREIRRLCAEDKISQAIALQQRANRVTAVLISFGFPGALRAAMGGLGFALGQPRRPQLPLLHDRQEALLGALEEVGWTELTAL